MGEVYIDFGSEGHAATVATGTYLLDAARRVGIKVACDDDNIVDEAYKDKKHFCVVIVSEGVELLSEPTKLEKEQLGDTGLKKGNRLACQARVEKSGEISVMFEKKKTQGDKTKKEEKLGEEYRADFEEMPLSEKYSSLLDLELIALRDTIEFVVNSPYEVAGKVVEVLAGFGMKIDKKEREAKVPAEHAAGKGKAGGEQAKVENAPEVSKVTRAKSKKKETSESNKTKKTGEKFGTKKTSSKSSSEKTETTDKEQKSKE
ncbi:MAG: 2Fe-2S iron-sulfur cluster-binding protein [Pyrinomonadaceae bacterium]